jgi:glycosyltransferase 2 family protein
MTSNSRYRHPGDVIRLIGSGLLLATSLTAAAIGADRLLGSRASMVSGVEPDTAVGRLLVSVIQLTTIGAVVGVLVAVLSRRRYRLLGSLAVGALLAGLLMWVFELVGDRTGPSALSVNLSHGGWLGNARFPSPAAVAGGVAVAVTLARWLTIPWRRTLWISLGLVAAARLVSGTVLPMQLVVAVALGATVGTGLLVVFGTPDRRPGPSDVVAALKASGFPAVSAALAPVDGKGSRPFIVVAEGGARFFVKLLGQDHRDADLLYRAYRFVRLRNVSDVRPASSLKQAVEHQALVAMMAERFEVHTPRIHGVFGVSDGSMMLVMEFVDGQSLAELPSDLLTDELMEQVWRQVDLLHRVGIAHRSLRIANLMVDDDPAPWIVDFSFSELAASSRAMDLDVAELLASLASHVGPERSVDGAVAALGGPGIADAVPLLQPLALSASTRRTVAGEEKVLERTRIAAASASQRAPNELEPIRRVRPRTLLMIALAAGAFYFILPQIAQVGSSFRAFQSAHWAWLPLVILMSILTYVAGAIGMNGTVPERLPLMPNLSVQFASSFVNRVSPANVGGMAANVRFLQKCGIQPASAVSAVGLNSIAAASSTSA